MPFNPIAYIKESRQELTRIVWPSRQETIRFTVIVIMASIIVGIYVAGIDYVLTNLAETFLYK